MFFLTGDDALTRPVRGLSGVLFRHETAGSWLLGVRGAGREQERAGSVGGGVGIAEAIAGCGVEGSAAELGLVGSLGLKQPHGPGF